MAGTGTSARKRLGWALLVGVSVLAAVLLVVHVVWPDRVDAVSLVLLGIMAAPALGLVLNSAELPGGVKIQFRDLQQRVARTEETADAAMGAATEQAALSRRRAALLSNLSDGDLLDEQDDLRRLRPEVGPDHGSPPSRVPVPERRQEPDVATGPAPATPDWPDVPIPPSPFGGQPPASAGPSGPPSAPQGAAGPPPTQQGTAGSPPAPAEPAGSPPAPAEPAGSPPGPAEPAGPPPNVLAPQPGGPALADFGVSGEASPPSAADSVDALADEYLRLRRGMPSGPARTRRFTDLAGRLMARTAADPEFYPLTALAAAHPGQRLAGYAYAFAQRDTNLIDPVYRATVAEEYPFSQFWGLKALHALLSETGSLGLTNEQAAALRAMRGHIGDDTSRVHEIDDILSLTAAVGPRPYGP